MACKHKFLKGYATHDPSIKRGFCIGCGKVCKHPDKVWLTINDWECLDCGIEGSI